MIRIRFFLNMVASLFFVTVIFVPSVVMLTTSDQEISESEQRTLTQLPANINPFNQQFTDFVANMEIYVNDQFGYRDKLIYWHNYLKVMGMHKSPTDRIVIGKDKWLFFTEPNQIADHQGLSNLSAADLATWANLFNARYDWLAEQGVEYVLIIPPDKKSVYPEYYPAQYPVIHENNTQLDQFLDYMANHSDLTILDLRVPLLAYKAENPHSELLYYTTDTHWTELGAFTAYQYILSQIQPAIPTVTPLNTADMTMIPRIESKVGNLRMMHMTDLDEFMTHDYSSVVYDNYLTGCVVLKYTGKFHQLVPNRVLHYHCPQNTANIVMVADSFGEALRAYLYGSFKEFIYVWKYSHFWQIDGDFELIISETQPALVLDLMLERNLGNPPPPALNPVPIAQFQTQNSTPP